MAKVHIPEEIFLIITSRHKWLQKVLVLLVASSSLSLLQLWSLRVWMALICLHFWGQTCLLLFSDWQLIMQFHPFASLPNNHMDNPHVRVGRAECALSKNSRDSPPPPPMQDLPTPHTHQLLMKPCIWAWLRMGKKVYFPVTIKLCTNVVLSVGHLWAWKEILIQIIHQSEFSLNEQTKQYCNEINHLID